MRHGQARRGAAVQHAGLLQQPHSRREHHHGRPGLHLRLRQSRGGSRLHRGRRARRRAGGRHLRGEGGRRGHHRHRRSLRPAVRDHRLPHQEDSHQGRYGHVQPGQLPDQPHDRRHRHRAVRPRRHRRLRGQPRRQHGQQEDHQGHAPVLPRARPRRASADGRCARHHGRRRAVRHRHRDPR